MQLSGIPDVPVFGDRRWESSASFRDSILLSKAMSSPWLLPGKGDLRWGRNICITVM